MSKSQKADIKNSNNQNLSKNNPTYKAAQENRANQLNPNHAEYKGNSKKK